MLFVISNLQAQSSVKQPEQVAVVEEAPIVVDLSPIGINATIKAPAFVKAIAGEWSNSIVGGNNFEISVEETTSDFAGTLNKIKADPANTILQTSDKAFMYKSTMMGREMAHFECVLPIGNKIYRFYDKRVVPLDEKGILPMYSAIITIKEK